MAVVDHNSPPIVVSVYWCGTGSSRHGDETFIQLFHTLCHAKDLSSVLGDLSADDASTEGGPDAHFKICVDGCAVAYGTSGMLWGTGLDAQADLLRRRLFELKALLGTQRKIVLNLFGLSRGGVACFVLARKLSKWDPAEIDVNILSFDPVPGNFVTTAKLDFFGLSNAWANMDLTKVSAVKKALLLYPYEALPTYAVHAPMIPRFAPNTHVVYEVILGCHQAAMWNLHSKLSHYRSLEMYLSASITRNFMASHGTLFHVEAFDSMFPEREDRLVELLRAENQIAKKASRATHSKGSIEILRSPAKDYLNKTHFILDRMPGTAEMSTLWQERPYFFEGQFEPNPAPTYSLHLSSYPKTSKSWLSSFSSKNEEVEREVAQ